MPQKIIPDSHVNRLNFFKNLKAQIALNAATLVLDAAMLAEVNAMLDALIAGYQALVDAEVAADQASADAALVFDQRSDELHALFANLKANPHFTDGMGVAMGIYATGGTKPADQIKPKIKAEAQPGQVRITGSKDYAELINIYMRLVGTVAWSKVGINRKKFPFDDQTPLKVAGTPETREYMARGVINDEEIGQPSDIVVVTFAG